MHTRIEPVVDPPASTTWEGQYHAHLRASGLLRLGMEQELHRCTESAFRNLNLGSGRRELAVGAIVGAVQSGKTGLMLNLAARALDRGFRVVVVLAGLKDDLRTQTALRFTRDLLQRGDAIGGTPGTFTHPAGEGYHGVRRDCWAPKFDEDVHHDEAFIHLFCSSLRRGRQVLAVAKKNVATLNRLREAYEQASSEYAPGSLPMLVLDDECDEASVSGDPDAPTPERISQLWEQVPQYVAYVGLTATPAANLLQDTDSALYPRAFVLAMRTPGDRDTTLTYFEPEVEARYTGGRTFYELLESHQRANLLVRARMSDLEFDGAAGVDDELEGALVAYFVSGGIRLAMQGSSFDDPERLPLPHTMLAHTESGVISHWTLCQRVVGITRRNAGRHGNITQDLRRVQPRARIDPADLVEWCRSDRSRWHGWYESFRASRETMLQIYPDRPVEPFPSWEAVERALPSVFGAVKLRVVNSDESTDAPLQFQAPFAAGRRKVPTDVYSIVIGGNRLSRGLTIEGLCISYYTRASLQLLEDTTVQRERWFGYRAKHLEFCRIFTHNMLAIRLRRFHEHDEDLRRQLAWNGEHGHSPVNATYRFLTLRDSLPTAKGGRGVGPQEIDISGARLFVDRVQVGRGRDEQYAAENNQAHAMQIAMNVLARGESLVTPRGDRVGYVLRNQEVEYVCSILDGFLYTFHNPDPSKGTSWNVREYYRDASRLPTTSSGLPPRSDPFLVAAYLRFWQAAFNECQLDPTRNTYRGVDSVSTWIPSPPPRFNVAVRYGSLEPKSDSPFRFKLLNRAVDGSGVVGSRWGGRGYGSAGDEWIDLPPPNGDFEAPREAVPGLILLHVIGRDAQGLNEDGQPYELDRPCLGLVIPTGGPCLRFVLAEGGS